MLALALVYYVSISIARQAAERLRLLAKARILGSSEVSTRLLRSTTNSGLSILSFISEAYYETRLNLLRTASGQVVTAHISPYHYNDAVSIRTLI